MCTALIGSQRPDTSPKWAFGRLSDAARACYQAVAKAIREQLAEGGHGPGVSADQIARSGPAGGQRAGNDLGDPLGRRPALGCLSQHLLGASDCLAVELL